MYDLTSNVKSLVFDESERTAEIQKNYIYMNRLEFLLDLFGDDDVFASFVIRAELIRVATNIRKLKKQIIC